MRFPRRLKTFSAALFFVPVQRIFAQPQETDSLQEFGRSIISSLFGLRELFAQQDDGAQNLRDLLLLLVQIAVIGIVLNIVYAIVKRLLYKKKFKRQKMRFEFAEEEVKSTKMDGISREQMEELLSKCRELSFRTDRHTARRGNSFFVATLTYRMAIALNADKQTAASYFVAALVYDSGFLDIPGSYFHSEILTSKQRRQIRTHVKNFEGYIAFLPEQLYTVCFNACYLHHENEDGTGYPEGLVSSEIPEVAKYIHVAESYASLVSERTYHRELSPKKAIADLRKKQNIYDPKLVDILATLV
ncbi:MAG: hypothetical protein J5930_10310 [Treponema sp.]|nr:hypothetical protein [Treponema sp.]